MHVRSTAFAVAVLAFGTSTAARAVELSAACKPIYAAMEKSLQVNHTTTSTRGPDVIHGVTVDGAVYLQMNGAWRKSGLSVQDNIAMSRSNLKDAQEYSCESLPDSVVDGTPVSNYATRTVNDGTVIETRISIAKGTGLVVSVENRQTGEGSAGVSVLSKYGYGNVKAPM